MTPVTVEERAERAIDKALPLLRRGKVDAALQILVRAAKKIEASK